VKICPYHLQSLRTALSSYGLDVRNSTGAKNPLHRAEALILARTIEEHPELVDTPACPICILIAPSWIDGAARATANPPADSDDGPYQRNPS
jgi:hypothetical protein